MHSRITELSDITRSLWMIIVKFVIHNKETFLFLNPFVNPLTNWKSKFPYWHIRYGILPTFLSKSVIYMIVAKWHRLNSRIAEKIGCGIILVSSYPQGIRYIPRPSVDAWNQRYYWTIYILFTPIYMYLW